MVRNWKLVERDRGTHHGARQGAIDIAPSRIEYFDLEMRCAHFTRTRHIHPFSHRNIVVPNTRRIGMAKLELEYCAAAGGLG